MVLLLVMASVRYFGKAKSPQALEYQSVSVFPENPPEALPLVSYPPPVANTQAFVIGGQNNGLGFQADPTGQEVLTLQRQIAELETEIASDERRILGLQVIGWSAGLGQAGLIADGSRNRNYGEVKDGIREAGGSIVEGLQAASESKRAELLVKIDLNRQKVQELRVQLTGLGN